MPYRVLDSSFGHKLAPVHTVALESIGKGAASFAGPDGPLQSVEGLDLGDAFQDNYQQTGDPVEPRPCW